MRKIIITEDQLSQLIVELHTDAILLRKMTYKSVFHSGKYKGVTVQELLDLKKTAYLRWIYYNMSMITFIDEILDIIRVPEEYRIPKPGKDPQKVDEVDALLYDRMGSNAKRHIDAVDKRHKGLKLLKTYNSQFSKQKLTLKNQGHPVNLHPKNKY